MQCGPQTAQMTPWIPAEKVGNDKGIIAEE